MKGEANAKEGKNIGAKLSAPYSVARTQQERGICYR